MESSSLREAVGKVPVRVGRYDVLGLIGHGGMGDVYEAIDTEHGGKVALKTLRVRELAPDRLLLFKNEFRTVLNLSHPNLVPLYELGCHDGLWFFTMERVDGVGLIDGIRRTIDDAHVSGPRTVLRGADSATRVARPRASSDAETMAEAAGPERVTPVCDLEFFDHTLAQILDALEYLHQRGVVHQDLKPSNILVEPSGDVRVVDFGLAQRIGQSTRLHSDRGVIGTPPYMAPELWIGAPATPASDLFALGCVMFQLLSGRLPVNDRWINVPEAPRLESVVADVPPALADICHRMLARHADDRPSIVEIRAALGLTRQHTAEELTGQLVGRVREREVLREALLRARDGASMIALVQGGSGLGKSALVHSSFDELPHGHDVLLLRGRCYERESVPYKAFDGMIDALAVRLSSYDDAEFARVLPPWFDELTQVFPVLSRPGRARGVDAGTVPALELRRRVLEALYQLFVRLAAQQPLVLEIDDLQWADADSLSLLWKLLHGAPPRLLLTLSLRPKEAAESADAARFLAAVRELPVGRAVSLELGPLDPGDAEDLARQTLRSLDLPDTLAAAIAVESGGVPFFLEELAHSVTQHRGADLAAVRLDHALRERTRALPEGERALVEVLAVANNPIPRAVACRAAGLEGNVPRVLGALHRAHFVHSAGVRAGDRVGIYHDRIRESVLAQLGDERTALIHLALGRALAALVDTTTPGPWLFDAVRHLGAAGSRLTDPAERLAAARLHLSAGRQARQAASFPLALRCFEDGVALLPPDAWERDYETSLGLHAGAAEAAYLNAAWAVMDERIAQVKANSRSLVDQMPAWVVQIDALAGRHEYLAAIDAGLEVLALLGVHLPRDPDEASVGAAFGRALDDLTRVGPEGLAALPDARDPYVLAAMRIQVRLCPVAFFAQQRLLALMACNLVTTSIEKGLSTATPNALALFGLILNSAGMFPVSHGWGQLAITLLDRWDDRSLEAATRHVVFNFVCPWIVPLRSVVGSSRAVFDLAQRTGDFEYGSYAAHMATYMALAAGQPLQPLCEDALWLGQQIRSFGQINAIHLHAPFEQLLKGLTGAKPEPWNLDDETFSEAAALAAAEATDARGSICVHRVAMGLSRFFAGRAREASQHLEVARAHLDAVPSCWMVPLCHQFAALSACAAWDELDSAERSGLRPRIDESLAALRELSGQAPINFAHRVLLVEGELSRLDGDREGALRSFERALTQAVANDWVAEVAITHDLMARVLGQLGRSVEATAQQVAARATYASWGASPQLHPR